MADPITVIGAAGSLVSIIDLLGKSIGTIVELRSQWQDADLAVVNLESQLAALNAALNRIKAWTELTSQNAHHQLVMDLDRSVACCRVLISKIDSEISKLQLTKGARLDTPSRLKLLLKTKDFENVQRMIERQTGALTLLLTACNMTVPLEQNDLLVERRTRQLFRIMESDAESLFVHRDVESLRTPSTTISITSSKRSVLFRFDTELFISRAYQRWIRGSVKKCLHEQQFDTPYMRQAAALPRKNEIEESNRSKTITRIISQDLLQLPDESTVLVLGSDSRASLVTMMEKAYLKGRSKQSLSARRPEVFKSVHDSAKALGTAMRQLRAAPESDEIWDHVDFIARYKPKKDQASSAFDLGFKTAIEAILGSPYYLDLRNRRAEFNLPYSAEYFFAEMSRITALDYTPNELDVCRAMNGTGWIHEARFRMGGVNMHMIDVGSQRSDRKKWIRQFGGVISILFVVDLDLYDRMTLQEPSRNRLMESVLLFDSIVNMPCFRRTSIILLLNNLDRFQAKLAESPLQAHFPGYSGGNDVNKAAKHLLSQFLRVNRAHLRVFSHLTSSHDRSIVRLISADIKETMMNRGRKLSLLGRTKDGIRHQQRSHDEPLGAY